jgi:hypothetical protein
LDAQLQQLQEKQAKKQSQVKTCGTHAVVASAGLVLLGDPQP